MDRRTLQMTGVTARTNRRFVNAGQYSGIGPRRRFGRYLRRLGPRQTSPDLREFIATAAVGEKTKMPHAHKSVRQNVQQKTTQELVAGHGHDFVTAIGVIFPSEGDLAFIDTQESAITDRNAICVAGKVVDNGFAERGTLALVEADVRDRLSAAYAELKGTWSASTERSIESDLRVFCAWCASVNAAILPALPQTVVQFIEAQAANAKTVATIRRYIYSIAVLHRLGQCPNPTKHASVTTALKRIVRELGTEQVQQGPLRWEHIEPALERLDTSMPRDAFAAALVCVAYDALCRPEEMPRIHVEHLMKDDDGHSLRIIKSKTDQSKRGVKVFLSASTYERVVHWLTLATITAGPVFCAKR